MSCCEVEPGCSRAEAFKERLAEVLECAAGEFPDLFVTLDAWRPMLLKQTDDYPDERTEVWVRLGESVDAFNIEKYDKLYQAEIGLIRQKVNQLILVDTYNLVPDDHVVINGKAFVIVDEAKKLGMQRATIDASKSRFKIPRRSAPTYRNLQVKAKIS